MNLEFFFVVLAHLLLLSTLIIILPIFKASKNNKLKVYRRWLLEIPKNLLLHIYRKKIEQRFIIYGTISNIKIFKSKNNIKK